VVTRGDRFILRSYSPVSTLGGGTVIAAPSNHKRRSTEAIADLVRREKSDPREDVLMLLSRPPYVLTAAEIASKLGLELEPAQETLADLVDSGALLKKPAGYISVATSDVLLGRFKGTLSSYMSRHPLRLSLSKEELRAQAAPEVDTKRMNLLLSLASEAGHLVLDGDRVRPVIPATPDPRLLRARGVACERLLETRLQPPDMRDLVSGLELTIDEQADLVGNLVESGDAVRLGDDLIMSKEAVDAALTILRRLLTENPGVTVAQFRDAAGTSRRYALPLLEYFDQLKITKRNGDFRVPLTQKES
jgi:selenocysteine-specific elongation factor